MSTSSAFLPQELLSLIIHHHVDSFKLDDVGATTCTTLRLVNSFFINRILHEVYALRPVSPVFIFSAHHISTQDVAAAPAANRCLQRSLPCDICTVALSISLCQIPISREESMTAIDFCVPLPEPFIRCEHFCQRSTWIASDYRCTL